MSDLAAAFAQPPDSHGAALRTYWRLFAGQRARLLAASAVYLVKHSPAVLLPVITGHTVDLLARRAPLAEIGACALFTALLIVQNLPGHRLYVRWISQAVRHVEAALRSALAERLLVLALPWWWRQSAAALQTKLLRDVESIGQLTIALADGLLGSGSGIVVALAITAWRAPQFLGLFLVTVPLAVLLVWATRERLGRAQRAHRVAVEALGDGAAEMARLLPLTRAHGLAPVQRQRVGLQIDQAARTGLALDQAGGRFGAMAWVGFQGLNALCLFTAAVVYALHWVPMTLGDVVLLSGFFVTLTNSVLGLAGLVPQVHRGIEAIRSLDELLRAAPVEAPGQVPPLAGPGRLVFEQVGYRHDAAERTPGDDAGDLAGDLAGDRAGDGLPGQPVAGVEGITLALEPGRLVALVGPSGSGKSTLALLACGLLRPQHGRLLLDGQALDTLDPQAWRRGIGWVPQDPLLGQGTLRENLVAGLAAVDEARLQRLLHDTGCAGFVGRLPQGLQTPLGQAAHRLSGGERQRLALVRALLREPRLLVLDEPTSALDGESERRVLATLAQGRGTRSTLVIAHRLSTVIDADTIVVMDAGRIVDQGHHGALLARCALYRRLWQPEHGAVPA